MPELQTTTTGLYEGKTLVELEDGVLGKLGEPSQRFNRYPQAKIRAQLNMAQLKFARDVRALKTDGIVTLKSLTRWHKLPSNFLDFTNPRWPAFFRKDGVWKRIGMTSEISMDNMSSSWRNDQQDTPQAVFPGGVYGNTRLIGVYPVPTVDGTQYVANQDTGLFVTASNVSLGGNIAGVQKAGYVSVAYYVDSLGRDLAALGAVVGMVVRNDTDGSQGAITAIGNQDAVNDRLTVTLSGGTDNDFDEGDTVIIFAGEYGVITSWVDDTERYFFGAEIGVFASLTVPDGNLYIPYVRRPRTLSIATQYPEIPPEYHESLEWYAAGVLLAIPHDGRVDPAKAASYLAIYGEDVTRAKQTFRGSNLMFPEQIEPDAGYIGDL